MRSLVTLLVLLTSSLPMPPTAVAAPDKATISDEAVEEFGKLPVRFNGRLTTFERYANSTVQRILGRDDVPMVSGESLSPTRWLLNLMIGATEWENYKLIPSPGKELESYFGFPEPQPLKDGSILYSPRELPLDKIAEERHKLGSEPLDGKRSERDTRVIHLFSAIRDVMTLSDSLTAPMTKDRPAAEIINSIQMIESFPIVRAVPRSQHDWVSIPRTFLSKIYTPDEIPPLTKKYLDVILGYMNNDEEAFSRAIDEYRKQLGDAGIGESPVNYSVPDGWVEVGIPVGEKAGYFSDATQHGRRLISLEVRNPKTNQLAGMNVIVFASEISPLGHLINDWRQGHNMLPQPFEEAIKGTEKVDSGGFTGIKTVITTPDLSPERRGRSHVAYLRKGSLTTIITMFGPVEMMGNRSADFDHFVNSLRMEDDEETKNWIGSFDDKTEGYRPTRGLLAIIPAEGCSIVVELLDDRPEQIDANREGFIAFAESIRPKGRNANPEKMDYALPDHWEKQEQLDMGRLALVARHKEEATPSYLQVSWRQGEWTDAAMLALLNHLRHIMEKEKLSPDENVRDHIEIRKVDGHRVIIVEIGGG